MGKRRKTHEFSDQFGEAFQGNADDHAPPQQQGAGGGAKGRGGSGRGGNVNFERHVPKFLQPYAHMLGQSRVDEDAPQVVAEQQRLQAEEDDEDDDKAAEQEAIQRALEENPELAAQLDGDFINKIEAGKEKEAGNKAFAAKDYAKAITHFSKCIELDPTNAVYFSNRSAAHANASAFDEALADAQAVLKLKPGWVKGHARAAVAYMGLQLYSEAKEAYEKAVKLEPDDQALQRALDRAIGLELQHMREHKHVFKKARAGGGGGAGRSRGGSGSSKPDKGEQGSSKARRKGGMLSFAEDEEEEDG